MFILLLLLGNFVKISQIYQKSWKVKAFVSQSCLTICNPIDCSPPGSSVHGILQARILQWFVMPFSRGSSWSRDWTRIFYISCTGWWILYHYATWEACIKSLTSSKFLCPFCVRLLTHFLLVSCVTLPSPRNFESVLLPLHEVPFLLTLFLQSTA